MRFTLPTADLSRWLTPAIKTTGADDMLPTLRHVEIRVRRDHVLALSTDRFRATCSRHRFKEAGRHKDITVRVHASLLTTALRAVSGGGRGAALVPVEVDVTADRVTFTREGASFSAITAEAEWKASPVAKREGATPPNYPDFLPVFAKAMSDHDGPAFQGPMGVNFHFLADWKSVAPRAEATVIVQGQAGVTAPYIVRMGDDLLGLLMPRRFLGGDAPPPIHDGWASALGLHTIPKENAND